MNSKKPDRIRTFRDACLFLEKCQDLAEQKSISFHENFFNLDSFRQFLKTVHIAPCVPIIVIAGSKGKGSVAHILERLLASTGLKTGLFTSPFLYDIREMMRIDGMPIPQTDFARILSRFLPALKKHPKITRFEILAAMAYRFFSEQKVDVMVLEVGLGGRLDATNVFDPTLTILTSIELEHTRILGKTIQSILREKLGITRKNIPLVINRQSPFVSRYIKQFSKKNKIPLVQASDSFVAENIEINRNGTFFDLVVFNKKICRFRFFLSLHGRVFVENAITALTAFMTWQKAKIPDRYSKSNFETCALESCRKVFASLALPGHFEIRSEKGKPFVFDVLHTPKSARAFRETLDCVFPGQPCVFLTAFLEDKKKHRILHELIRPNDVLILTSVQHARAYNSQSLYNFFIHSDTFNGRIFLEDDMKKAFCKISSLQSRSFLPCIIGSHYLLREAKKR